MPEPILAFESDLNAIVLEYLEYGLYSETASAFKQECSDKGKISPETNNPRSDISKRQIQHDLIALFSDGDRESFMKLWNESIPQITRDRDQLCQRLEFYLQIYFAVYHLRNNHLPNASQYSEEAKNAFREFLETRGSKLSQTTEFLPYYALPFVANPATHPSFKELFSDSYVPDLEHRLEKFLSITLKSNANPRLFDLYRDGSKDTQTQMQTLQQQHIESERRTARYMKQYAKLQNDYHNVINITAELVDTVEATVNGTMVTPEYLQSVCARLFSNQQNNSVDFTRPGTAGSILRGSININSVRKSMEDVPFYPSLDFVKIKEDIAYADDRPKGLLLQALRWRLTQSVAGEQRDNVIRSYVSNDLLGCVVAGAYRNAVLNALRSPNFVGQYTARLFNAVASLSYGRKYLVRNDELLSTLEGVIKSDAEALTREMSLGTLQKLSLVRAVQTQMIKDDIIEWLVEELSDIDSLSDYTVEYSVALLMNLCLRTRGKLQTINVRQKLLTVLADLLGYESSEIRPYINGTLYSILAVSELRESARAMGLEDILKTYISSDNREMNRQIEYIITQLNSDDVKPKNPDDSDDEQDEDDDEEEADAMEVELDKNEVLRAAPNEESGERLLGMNYLSVLNSSPKSARRQRDSEPLMRPITPGNIKSSSLSKHRPVSSIDAESERSPRLQRPPTRSGDSVVREISIESVKTDVDASEAVSKTLGKDDLKIVKSARTQSGVNPSKKGLEKLADADLKEYSMVFSSRPRILRTPDGAYRNKPSTPPAPVPIASTLPPKFSDRPLTGSYQAKSRNSQVSRIKSP